MMRAFLCEWTKLWRVKQILALWGTMVGIVVLLATIFFGSAGETPTVPGPGQRGSFLTLADLAGPGGLSVTLLVSSQLLGIVTFVLVAGSMAGEYSQGTLKILLARDPVRLRVLAGKSAALLLFSSVGIALAALAQTAMAVVMATARGIAMDAWWDLDNLVDVAALLLRILLAAWAWGMLGLMLATLLRSAPAAIGIGIGYTIVAEGVLGLVLPEVHKYLPGQALQTFINAGKPLVGQASLAEPLSLVVSAALGTAYAVAFATVTSLVFHRRDVTN